jgi:FO synthase
MAEAEPLGLRRALARARDGKSLDRDEAAVLLAARGDALAELSSHAGRVRDRGLDAVGRPGVITYSRKVFIPLTRLCRDRCHYCTFATAPHRVESAYLPLDEVVAIARDGAALGCTEALFTLGDRPELRWTQAAEWLEERGYASTLEYLRAAAIAVLEETGLLPHLNPGVLSWAELQRLKPVAPSMGMMLETTAHVAAHVGSPDKDPAVRLRVLEDAGRSNVPFTTGLLLGIGETPHDRVDTLLAIRKVAREYGGIQEVIVQNFRAKPDTAMRSATDFGAAELAAAVAVTRLLLGPTMRVQAPPNLVDLDETRMLVDASIDDWGGVSPLTPDHVNPERPWPHLEQLAAMTAVAGFDLRQRLAAYPPYLTEPWLDPRIQGHVDALAGRDGLVREDVVLAGKPWQEPESAWASTGRATLHLDVDTSGRSSDRRSDFDDVYGDWHEIATRIAAPATHLGGDVATALRKAADDPSGLDDSAYFALLTCDGAELATLRGIADDVRRDAVGDEVTYVVNRNINFTNVCYVGCRFCAFAQRRTDADAYTLSVVEVGERAAEAQAAGATEVCMQGGIHPDLPGSAYFDLAREVKRRAPGIHVHAFSPMEVMNGVARTGLSLADWLIAAREAGVDSLPGTAAEILDDDVRWVLTKGKLPAASWVEVISTAHRLGIPTTATMMYGHVDTPAHWLRHLRVVRQIQDETGGFTEFVPLPFVHTNAPIYLAGIARPGPTRRDDLAVHAVARLVLHGAIDHIQASWVKLGVEGCVAVLAGGVDDLGGTLMEETISRMAGSQHGSRKQPRELEAIAAAAGRPARQRSTLYGPVVAPVG